MINITVNGEQKSIQDGTTVMGFIDSLGIKVQVMAVAINMNIVKKADWETHQIVDSDKLELLDFVGGG